MTNATYTGCPTAFAHADGTTKVWQKGDVDAKDDAYTERLLAVKLLTKDVSACSAGQFVFDQTNNTEFDGSTTLLVVGCQLTIANQTARMHVSTTNAATAAAGDHQLFTNMLSNHQDGYLLYTAPTAMEAVRPYVIMTMDNGAITTLRGLDAQHQSNYLSQPTIDTVITDVSFADEQNELVISKLSDADKNALITAYAVNNNTVKYVDFVDLANGGNEIRIHSCQKATLTATQ